MATKYQVFVSSTFDDLRDEREQMIKAVLEMGHIPVGMEMFSAADEEQWNIIARQIEESDYYAVILAHRYGSTTASGLSFTEKEYDHAVAKGVPVLGFVIEDSSPWPAERIDKEEDKRLRLASFKKKVKSKMVNFWSTKDDLHARFSVSLMKAFASHPRVGWIRSNQVAGPEVIRELSRLSAENSQLRSQIGELQLKEKDQERNQLKEMLETLSKCRIEVYVRKTVGDWGQPISSTLLAIFEAVAPRLLIENSRYNMASDIALQVTSDTNHYPHWPVPDNYLNTWLADLHSLDLVQPSPKRHSVNDKNDYWCLTDLGADVYKHIRRLLLEYGMKSDEKKPEAPEAPEGAPEVGDAPDAYPAAS